MASIPQYVLEKIVAPLNLVKQVINSWQGILILNGHLIKLTIFYAQPECPSLFFTNKVGAPHGDTLG
jgi:hypothetical protein